MINDKIKLKGSVYLLKSLHYGLDVTQGHF